MPRATPSESSDPTNPTGTEHIPKRYREEVQICGNTAHLTTATTADSHHDYLEFAYPLGDKFYPIQIATQTPVANVSRYRADLDAILSGVRISAQ